MKNKKCLNSDITIKTRNSFPIRVIYKKVGQAPEVKIINNVYKLKKAIVQRNLDIIPYEKLFIICHKEKIFDKNFINIYLPLGKVLGDLIVVDIDRKKREFKSLTQEDIIWCTKDLLNKEPLHTTKVQNFFNVNKTSADYERCFDYTRYNKTNNFEKTLINVLVNLELVLDSILKINGYDKK